MVKCDNCGDKIGFFGTKHSYVDRKGNSVKYCSKCEKKQYERSHSKMTEYEDEMLEAQRITNLRLAWIIFLLIIIASAISYLQ